MGQADRVHDSCVNIESVHQAKDYQEHGQDLGQVVAQVRDQVDDFHDFPELCVLHFDEQNEVEADRRDEPGHEARAPDQVARVRVVVAVEAVPAFELQLEQRHVGADDEVAERAEAVELDEDLALDGPQTVRDQGQGGREEQG